MSSDTRKKILVVEDYEPLLNAMVLTLNNESKWEVLIARNGEEAEAAIYTQNPDLVLLDLYMPVKDGFQVLEDLHAQGITAKIPIVVVSNFTQTDDINRVKALGIREYLIKTDLKIKDLSSVIKKYL